MRRAMALTAAAVVCCGFVGFAATSFASPDATPDGANWSAVEPADTDENDDDQRQGPGDGGEPELRQLPRLPAIEEDLLHGETVLQDPETGELVYQVQQRGEVTARGEDSVTVESADGTTWEWSLTDDTLIRSEDSWDADPDTIEVGDTVMANGTREGDVRTATSIGDPIERPADFGEGPEELPGPEDLEGQDLEELPGDRDLHQLPEPELEEESPEEETPSQSS
ncbi:hypothetical protein [Streptomyces sp. B6B3]|uniref:hypothetical protein n=1 Tax=Streptomyces sp. B6B3 TaxID=3153570 RepID=UPI00325F4400